MALLSDTFAANPLVQALAKPLGLEPVIGVGEGAQPPTQSAPQVKPGATPMRAEGPRLSTLATLRLANAARENASRGMGRSSLGMPSVEPGVMSQDTLNDPMVAGLLKQYGVSNQVNVDPHLFIHNPEAWMNHPALAGLLEGALKGAAFTKPSNTIGEGISNVAQSLIDARTAEANHINAQLMTPFQQAAAVANLKGISNAQQLQEAQQQEAIANTQRANAYSRYLDAQANAKPEMVNPLYKAESDYIDAVHSGDAGKIKQTSDILQNLYDWQGLGHNFGKPQKPMDVLLGKYKDSVMAKLMARPDVNGDESKITPDMFLGAIRDELDMENRSKKLGKYPPNGGVARMSDEDKKRLDDLQKQRSEADLRLRTAQNGRAVIQDPDTGQMLFGKQKAAYLAKWQKTEQDLQTQIDALTGNGQPAASAPTPRVAPRRQTAQPQYREGQTANNGALIFHVNGPQGAGWYVNPKRK